MGVIKRFVRGVLPEPARCAIRPIYRRFFPLREDGNVRITRIGGFHIAHRGGVDKDVLAYSFARDLFFRGVPEYRPAPDHVIIDVGAHIGTFSLLAASRVPRGRVYAIEPCERSYDLCRINALLNRADNLDVSHLALADRAGSCVLYHESGSCGHSIVDSHEGLGERVRSLTLAGFLESKAIRRCHFLKMNCEGAEFPILLSTPVDVLRRIEVMVVLYHCDKFRGATEEALVSHLKDAGFETTLRNKTGKRGWIVASSRSAQAPAPGVAAPNRTANKSAACARP